MERSCGWREADRTLDGVRCVHLGSGCMREGALHREAIISRLLVEYGRVNTRARRQIYEGDCELTASPPWSEIVGGRAIPCAVTVPIGQGGTLTIRRRLLVGTIASALVATAGTAMMPGAASAAPRSDATVVSSTATVTPDVARLEKGTGAEAQQTALKAYWNADRMKAARPDSEMPAVKAAAARAVTPAGTSATAQG